MKTKSTQTLMSLYFTLTVLVFVFFTSPLMAQYDQSCAQTEIINAWFAKHPELRQRYEEIQSATNEMQGLPGHSRSGNDTVVFTIPLVFHVLHINGAENIADEQIFDQVRILNRDYQKQNADTILIDTPFVNNIAYVGFAFELASIDPQGNCTNGITRHYDYRTSNWDTDNLNDFNYSWPTDQYLNIYVVKKLNINATAYAFLPGVGVPDYADVIVMTHNMCGSIGTGTVANSRVLTHEVAHWFDIQHTWGSSNAPGVACGDDLIHDTPITKGFSTCNIAGSNVCNPGIYENVQNYMDYSPCKIMFTNGQADRMHATIASGINGRDNISSPANLVATGVNGAAPCSTKADFFTIRNTGCAPASFTFISLSQFGSQAGTTLWSFPGGNPVSSTDSIVTVSYPDTGVYPVTITASGSNGTNAETKTNYITIVNGMNGLLLPYTCDFEGGFSQTGLEIINQQQDSVYWRVKNGIGANGTGNCIYLNNFPDSTNYGHRDYFETPIFDFSNTTAASLSFYYSYAKRYEAHTDSFWVQYSLDCGGTWTKIVSVPSPNSMAANTGGLMDVEFIPDSSQWKKAIISSGVLSPLNNKQSVKLRFFFKNDYYSDGSNNIYIDEINLTGTVVASVQETEALRNISVYPNPSDASVFLEFVSKAR